MHTHTHTHTHTYICVCVQVSVSVAYGGMQYAIVDAASVGLRLEPQHGREICRLGEMIKVATREQHPVSHPEFDYPGPDILVFREPAEAQRPRAAGSGGTPLPLRARNTVVMSNGVLDWERPETWTGMLDRRAGRPCRGKVPYCTRPAIFSLGAWRKKMHNGYNTVLFLYKTSAPGVRIPVVAASGVFVTETPAGISAAPLR